MLEEGATIIDIGGESTRPNDADEVSEQEELHRVVPVVEVGAKPFLIAGFLSILQKQL